MAEHERIEFKELVSEFYQPLYRFGYSLAKNEHEASDLVQQTFLIYAEKGENLRDTAKIKSWLFTTLYREFLRIRRRGNKFSNHEPELLEVEAPPISPEAPRALDGETAMAALAQVDEVYRAPLTLFYVQDLSYKEIAESLDVPIGTVMSRLSRGKTQLKRILSTRMDEQTA